MICPRCSQPGVPRKTTFTEQRRIPWTHFRCPSPSCTFIYRSFIDGRRIIGQPTWAFPSRWIKEQP